MYYKVIYAILPEKKSYYIIIFIFIIYILHLGIYRVIHQAFSPSYSSSIMRLFKYFKTVLFSKFLNIFLLREECLV